MRWGHQVGWGACSVQCLPSLIFPFPFPFPPSAQILRNQIHGLFFEFTITAACHERSSLGAKRYEATSSRSDGKLKSIAENRSGVEVNLQQGEDHRRPWSKAQLRFRGQSPILAWDRGCCVPCHVHGRSLAPVPQTELAHLWCLGPRKVTKQQAEEHHRGNAILA